MSSEQGNERQGGTQEASRAAPVPKPWRIRGLGRPWRIRGLRGPWRIRGLGKPWRVRLRARGPSPCLGLYGRSPTTPPPKKNSLGKAGALSGWYVGGVGSWGCPGSMGFRGSQLARTLGGARAACTPGGAQALEGAVLERKLEGAV